MFADSEDAPEVLAILKAHETLAELPEDDHSLFDAAETYYQGDIHEVSVKVGYGARLSAPGYMDCTEWSVFDSPDEALAYLDEMYGDEDED